MIKFHEIFSRVFISLAIAMLGSLVLVPILVFIGLQDSNPTVSNLILLSFAVSIFLTSVVLYPKLEKHRHTKDVARDKILNEQYKQELEKWQLKD